MGLHKTNTPVNWVKQYPLVSYFVLVFIAEWVLFFFLSGILQPLTAILVGSWLPNAVGLLVTYVSSGMSGLRNLAMRVVLWQIDARWYVIALLSPAALAGLAIGLFFMLGMSPPELAPQNQVMMIFVASIFTGALGEELGWRGTALPRLQARFSPIKASLILGAVWALYHLPAFFLTGSPQEGVPVIPFLIGAVELTILITWTFNRTRGSLVPVFLYHFAFNFTLSVTDLPGNTSLFWLFVAVTGLMAIAVVAMDWERFSQPASASHPDVWTIR